MLVDSRKAWRGAVLSIAVAGAASAYVEPTRAQDATANTTRNPRRPAYSPAMVRSLQQVRRRVEAMPELVGRGSAIAVRHCWICG